MKDPIKPSHYHDRDGSGIHCHMAQRAMLGKDGYTAYLAGMVAKYTWRYRDKNGLQDLKKASECLRMLQDELSSGATDDTHIPADNTTIYQQHLEEGKEGNLPSTPLPDMDRPPSSASRISIWGINPATLSVSSYSGGERWCWFEEGQGPGQPGEGNI